MVLQSTASLLCMACVARVAHLSRARVRPKRQLGRLLHRTRNRLARMSSRCGCCCGWPAGTVRARRRSHCPPTYGRSASYPGRRCSFGTFGAPGRAAGGRYRRRSVAASGLAVRKISASGRYAQPWPVGEGAYGLGSSWPGRRRAFRVRDRSLVALRMRRRGDPHGRQIRCTPDWSENAVSGDHLWVPTSVSGDCCCVGDNECTGWQ
uniref:Secreted protein n=1 Tax=Anopheles melas TaxID=34690 RepID=A0A182UF07_9DIPT